MQNVESSNTTVGLKAMVVCKEENQTRMEMDKILEEFLMPPPDSSPRSLVLRKSTDSSLRDGSSSSLDRSNNSSSTNTSWNSSCSCHSMASLSHSGSRSAFVFHNQPILPPLLCPSSRMEMKVYKMKAIEKEEKQKQKERQRLISRVEAILSSVEISPAKSKRYQPPEQRIDEETIPNGKTAELQTESSNHNDISSCHDDDSHTSKHFCTSSSDVTSPHSNNDIPNGSHNNRTESVAGPHGDEGTDPDFHGNHTDISSHGNHETPIEDNVPPVEDEDSSDDEVTSFHDNAYRSSLRNLLQKSMTLNQSSSGGDKSCQEQGTLTSKSSSDTDEDITGNTVINTNASPPSHSDPKPPESPSPSVESPSKMEENDLFSDEETLVESIVESVLTEAKNQILNVNNEESPLLHDNHNCEVIEDDENGPEPQSETLCPGKQNVGGISTWETPNVKKDDVGVREMGGSAHKNHGEMEDSPLSITGSQCFELHNQSTSTKVDMPLGDAKVQNGEDLAHKKLDDKTIFEDKIGELPILPTDVPTTNFGDCDQTGEDICPQKFLEISESPILPLDGLVDTNLPLGGSEEDEGQKLRLGNGGSPILPPNLENDIVELSGKLCYDATVGEAYLPNEAGQASIATTNDDLTVLHPVLSDTVSDVTSTMSSEANHGKEMKENCDPAMETGSLSSLKRSLSFTLEQPSRTFESAVIEAVSQHFHGFQEDLSCQEVEAGKEIAAAKQKQLLHARVRRGSYTLDEPSPYLVKNKETLTIEPGHLDDDVCSELTVDTAPQDVKRKLDLPSDSEESSIPVSAQKKDVKENGPLSKAELNVVNLCRILQDQHKEQMESMKRKHQEQLQTLQKEFVQGPNKMSLPLDGVVSLRVASPHDVTVSPSLSSTEYRDIRIGVGHREEYPPEHAAPDTLQDLLSYQESDVSRITDVELTPTLHEKLCKFSALCKGHLTRRLLGSHKVQDILQIIRDTSRLILSVHSEINESQGMDSIRDTYLEDRLITQLRSAMHQLHNIFFNISSGERMYIIAQSTVLDKMAEKLPKIHKHQKLSAATQKSLERKRLLSSSSPPQHPAANYGKAPHKEIKSKISHIWKTDPVKSPEKKSPPVKLPSNTTNHTKKTSTTKGPSVISQSKAKSPVTSQTRPLTSSKKVSTSSHNVTSQRKAKSPTTSQTRPLTSTRKPMTSSQVTSEGKMESQTKLQNPVTSRPKTLTSSHIVGSKNHSVMSQAKTMMSQSHNKPTANTKPSSSRMVPSRKKTTSPLKSHSGNVRPQGNTMTSQTLNKPEGSKVIQRKTSQSRKTTPLANTNKASIGSKS